MHPAGISAIVVASIVVVALSITTGLYVFRPKVDVRAVLGTYPTAMLATTGDVDLAQPPTHVDGSQVLPGWLVLVHRQRRATDNGLYYVKTNHEWRRHPAMSHGTQCLSGATCYVASGEQYEGTLFSLGFQKHIEDNGQGFPALRFEPLNRAQVLLRKGLSQGGPLTYHESGRLAPMNFQPRQDQFRIRKTKGTDGQPTFVLDYSKVPVPFSGSLLVTVQHQKEWAVFSQDLIVTDSGLLLSGPLKTMQQLSQPVKMAFSHTTDFTLQGLPNDASVDVVVSA